MSLTSKNIMNSTLKTSVSRVPMSLTGDELHNGGRTQTET